MGATNPERFLGKGDAIIFKGDITFGRMNGTLMAAEKFPPQHKIIDEVLDDSTIDPHEPSFYTELDVDSANGLHCTTIDANRLALVGLDLVLVEGGMPAEQTFTNA